VALYVALMLHDAIASRTVVIEPFDAPPRMADRGLTGRVIASALLDQLTRLQAASQSSATRRELANSWTGDIKLEVPETGISLGELDRLLKQRLGNDIHVGGDLVQTEGGGLELTVRGDGVMPKTFTGAAADLRGLTTKAAEYVYGQTQYLLRAGRNQDAVSFGQQAILTAPRADRPFILNAWADALSNQGGNARESLALENAALALKPDYWTAYGNAILDASALGDQEGAWRIGQAMLKAAGGRPGAAPESAYEGLDWLTGDVLAERNAVLADAEAHAGIGATTQAANPTIAGLDMDLHDTEDASLRLKSFDMTDAYAQAMAHWVRGRLATVANDPETAWREMSAWETANANPAISQGDPSYHCIVAPAAEAAGHPDLADAALKAGGHVVDCARFRADILDRRGDWPAAQRAYQLAVAVAPDLPFAYFSWGQALARHNRRGACAWAALGGPVESLGRRAGGGAEIPRRPGEIRASRAPRPGLARAAPRPGGPGKIERDRGERCHGTRHRQPAGDAAGSLAHDDHVQTMAWSATTKRPPPAATTALTFDTGDIATKGENTWSIKPCRMWPNTSPSVRNTKTSSAANG
jgi:tetratricopeptide (TPR) repeat protein